MTESQNVYFTSALLNQCGYCRGKERCNEFTILNDEQLLFMRKHKPYKQDQAFCKECMKRVTSSLLKYKNRSAELSSQSLTKTRGNC